MSTVDAYMTLYRLCRWKQYISDEAIIAMLFLLWLLAESR